MNKRTHFEALIYTVVFILSVAAFAVHLGMTGSPAALGSAPDPQKSAVAFFDALCAGDPAAADKFVAGYSGLGFTGETRSDYEQMLYDALMESYSYELAGDASFVPGTSRCTQMVRFSHLDLNALSTGMDELFNSRFAEITASMPIEDTLDEEGQYKKELIERALCEALSDRLQSGEQLCVTENINIELEYTADGWQVVVSDRLADAILGGTEVQG